MSWSHCTYPTFPNWCDVIYGHSLRDHSEMMSRKFGPFMTPRPSLPPLIHSYALPLFAWRHLCTSPKLLISESSYMKRVECMEIFDCMAKPIFSSFFLLSTWSDVLNTSTRKYYFFVKKHNLLKLSKGTTKYCYRFEQKLTGGDETRSGYVRYFQGIQPYYVLKHICP